MKDRYWEKIWARVSTFDKQDLNSILQRLSKERKLLVSIFNLLQEAILIVDDNGVLIFFNDSAMHLLGITEKDAYRLTIWKIIPELASFFSSQSKGPQVISKQIEVSYPRVRSVRLYLQPFMADIQEEEQKRFIILLNDITEEKISTEKRIADEKLESVIQLSSEVAHELGNPLNSIQIHLQLIERQLKELEVSKSLLRSFKICTEELERLDNIIKNFLKAIRPIPIVRKNQNILSLVKKVLAVLQPQLENLNIAIELHSEGLAVMPNVYIDVERVHQALFNVLKNAIEAIGANGCIRISLYIAENDFVVAVGDSGKGFEEKKAAKIFQTSFSDKLYGRGIGSLIIQRVMQEHGGKVDIETKSGVGTVVLLRFPLKEQRLKLLPDSNKIAPRAPRKKKKG